MKQEIVEQYRQLLNRLHEAWKEYIVFWTFYKHIRAGATIDDLVNIRPKQGWSNKWSKYPNTWKMSVEKIEEARVLFEKWYSMSTLSKRYWVSQAYFYPHWFRRNKKTT